MTETEGDHAVHAMRVVVLGPGGVGGLLAGLLSRAGDVVTVLARDATAVSLRADGVTVRSDQFGHFTAPVAATSALEEPVDACFVTVKATQLESALDRLPVKTMTGALLVPFLNGVDHVETLRQRYPTALVAPATIRVESTRSAPGVIEHTSPFTAVEVASGDDDADQVRQLVAHLQNAGLDVQVREDETAMLWDKLAFLAPMALLTTHAAADVGTMRTERREDLVAVIQEIASVAERLGVRADTDAVVAALDALPGTMQSSMQRDAKAGRPTELEAIGGGVLRAADRFGVPVPVTARLVADLRSRS